MEKHWQAPFSCEISCFQIWNADKSGSVDGGKAWIVINKSYNGVQTALSTLSMNFHGDYTPNTAVPEGRAYFISEDGECSGNSANIQSKFCVVDNNFSCQSPLFCNFRMIFIL